MEMPTADGFTKSAQKPRLKAPNPNFISAFDTSSSHLDPLDPNNHPGARSHVPVRKPISGTTEKKTPAPMRTLKPPVFDSPSSIMEKSNHRRCIVSMSDFRVVLDKFKPVDKPFSRLPPPLPPVPSSSRKKAISLKELPTPLITPRPAPTKPMKTISTTRVARATDLTTDDGNAELLSIFLQDHDHDPTPMDRELQRGLQVSPRKGGTKGKGPKFIRGGLAERASHQLSNTHTALALWQKETEVLSRSSRRLTPDLRLVILKILHTAQHSDPSASANPSKSGLALCGRPNPIDGLSDELYLVLLSFATILPPDARVRSAQHFKEGNEVHMWRPWHEVPIQNTPAIFPDTTYPHHSSCTDALICSRFLLIDKL